MTIRLVLLRHGLSEFTRLGLFSGWYDSPLSDEGRAQARNAAALMQAAGIAPTVVHTSRLDRVVETSQIALRVLGRGWVDVRRTWRLNTVHWGDFTGRSKSAMRAEHGFGDWRADFGASRPPPIRDDNDFNPNAHPMYGDLLPEAIPLHENLDDVQRRVLPYWHDVLVPELRSGRTVLVVASGIPLTVLMKQLDPHADDFAADGRLAQALPFVYELDAKLRPIEQHHPLERALDLDAAAAHYASTSNLG